MATVSEEVVEPKDWADAPCSYLQTDFIVFQTGELIMIALDVPDKPGVLGVASLDKLTADSKVNVLSDSCGIRCKGKCVYNIYELVTTGGDRDLGGGCSLSETIGQPTFNNSFCDLSIFEDPHVTGTATTGPVRLAAGAPSRRLKTNSI